MASTLARTTASGVRSSCVTSARKPRRSRSSTASRALIWLNARASARASRGPRSVTRTSRSPASTRPAAATRSSTGSVRPRSQRALLTTASTTSSEDGEPDHDADARAGPDETGIGPGDRRHEHGAEGDEDDDRAAESLGCPRSAPTPRPRAPRSMASGATVGGGQGSVSGHQGGRCRCLMRRARRIGSRRRRPSGGSEASADRARSCGGCS